MIEEKDALGGWPKIFRGRQNNFEILLRSTLFTYTYTGFLSAREGGVNYFKLLFRLYLS